MDEDAAGFEEDGVGGGGVPFHGGDVAQVGIGLAGGDEAEFERATDAEAGGIGEAGEQGFDFGAGVVAAGDDAECCWKSRRS